MLRLLALRIVAKKITPKDTPRRCERRFISALFSLITLINSMPCSVYLKPVRGGRR